MELSKEELIELEQQLSCPSDTRGIEVGHRLHATNSSMTMATIQLLKLVNGDNILELGHGNCHHLPNLLAAASNLTYRGLEVSELMYSEAKKYNQIHNDCFMFYDGKQLPFPNNCFDKVFSVNTIYFWDAPKAMMQEIERVLKPGGICVLTYAEKSFMEQLPYVGNRFTLYDDVILKKIVSTTRLHPIEFRKVTETVESKTGEMVERPFTMAKIQL